MKEDENSRTCQKHIESQFYGEMLEFELKGTTGRKISDEDREKIQALKSEISESSVEFYPKLDEILQCGEKGYLQNFAYKYG